MKRLIAFGVAVLTFAGAGWPVASASRMSRGDKRVLIYRRDVGGATAFWDAEWRIAPQQAGIGVIVAAAVCDDEGFLLDRQLAVVHRVDLPRGEIVADLGAAGPSSEGLREVTGLAADCQHRTLYVVDGTGVAVLEMDSGVAVKRFAKPLQFVNSVGTAVLDAHTQALYVPGLWPAASDWLTRPVDRMFEGHRVGYRLDLRTGQTAPVLPAVERGCWSLGPNCLSASLDAVPGPGSARWLAAHQVGTLVGVYDSQFRLMRNIDVRSPKFLDSGARNGSQSLTEMVAWNEDNSVIRDTYAFGGSIVTVHSFNRTRGWKPGQAIDFEVFMNIHTLEGAGVASDIRLPDLPVGRDATSLYVVDYGAAGRRVRGNAPISLFRIPVDRQ
jgi:hypothetical protein